MFYWETRPCTHRSQFVDGSLVVILLFITLIETTTGRAGEAREREWFVYESNGKFKSIVIVFLSMIYSLEGQGKDSEHDMSRRVCRLFSSQH